MTKTLENKARRGRKEPREIISYDYSHTVITMETVHPFTILRRAHVLLNDGHLATKWSRRENAYVQRDFPTCRAECLRTIRRREARPNAAANADRVLSDIRDRWHDAVVTTKAMLEASAARKVA